MPAFTVSNTGGNINAGAAYVGGVAPGTSDTIIFTATSGNLNLNTSFTISGIDFTNYVNTFTVTTNATLTVTGPVNFGTGGYTQAGANTTGGILVSGSRTITSNGTTWSRKLAFTGASATITLADDLRVTGTVQFNGSSTSTNFSGNTFYIGGSFSCTATIGTQGTTAFIFNGTGTWTSGGGIITNNFTINTAGTLTLSGTVYYNTGTFKWTAGTVVTTGSNFTMGANTTLDTNGTSLLFSTITMNGTGATLTLTTDCRCAQFTMGVNAKVINGANLYNAGSLAAPSNTGNVTGTSTIIMNGTGTISAAGGAYIGINLTINTAGTITLATCNYGIGTFKYIAGTVNSTGTVTIVKGIATLDTVGMSFLNVSLSGSFTNPLHLPTLLTITGTFFFPTNTVIITGVGGFTCGTLQTGQGTLTLPAGIVNTVTTNMINTTATLAVRGLINCSTVGGTKAILNLAPGATQDNGYLSNTDVDSSGGVTIWTYKGVLTREVNWNQLSTDPRKHILKFGTKIMRY